jgi:antitoxin component YwqK of YwqJK toxin-antitoxin module
MRKLLIGLLFITSSLFAQRDTMVNRVKFHLIADSDTGTTWIQQKIVKKGVTKFNGVYYEFYPGGKLKAKGYYKRGKRTGKWLRYYQGGQKSEEGFFDAGFKTELWMTYYESGVMSWKGNFFKNMRSGYWRYFYEDGKLKAMTRYRVKAESVAKKPKSNVRGMSIRVNREITYSISPADSLVEYYPDGKLRTRILYGKEGGLNGVFDFYYPDGKINFHGAYTNGKESGTWIWYCTDGIKQRSINYSDANPANSEFGVICIHEAITPWLKWEIETITP